MAYKIKKLRVLERGLVDILVESKGKRSRDWLATVKADPNAPGGLTRKFWDRARGELVHYVVPETLAVFDVLEFAADAVSWSGTRTPDRIYAVVGRQDEKQIIVAVCESATSAFMLSSDLLAQWETDQKSVKAPVDVDDE